jgi:hypothetical protein
MPLNFEKAKGHGALHGVRQRESGEPFPILTSLPSLGELGTGIPLFFDFQLKSFALIAAFGMAYFFIQWTSFWSPHDHTVRLAWNATPTRWHGITTSGRGPLGYEANFSCKTALSGIDGPLDVVAPDPIAVFLLLFSFGFLGLTALFLAVYPSWQRSFSLNIDKSNTTVDNFAVYLDRLPEDSEVGEQHIYNWLDAVHGKQVDIVRVVLAFDVYSLWTSLDRAGRRADQMERLQVVEQDMQEILAGDDATGTAAFGCCCRRVRAQRTLDGARAKAEKLKREAAAHRGSLAQELQSLKVAGAYVIFNSKAEALLTLKKLRPRCCARCRKERKWPEFPNQTQEVRALPATHPSDVYWEHNICKSWRVILRRFSSWAICTAVVLASFALATLAEKADYNIIAGSGMLAENQGLIFETLTVMAVEFVLYFIIDILIRFEYRQSLTSAEQSFMRKALLSTCLNVVGAVYVAHWLSDSPEPSSGEMDWFAQGGLAEEIVFLLIVDIISAPFFALVPVSHILLTLPSRCLVNMYTSHRTQEELNELYLGPEFSLSDRVVDVILTLFFAFVAAPLVPLAPLFAAAMIGMNCILDRIMLLRIARRPHWYSDRVMLDAPRLASKALAVVPFVTLLLLRTPQLSWATAPVYTGGCIANIFHPQSGLGGVVALLLVGGVVLTAMLLSQGFAECLWNMFLQLLCCRPCRKKTARSVDSASSAPEQTFLELQKSFLHHYHKENPVYTRLPASINPEYLESSDEASTGVVGTRHGLRIHAYLADSSHLDEMYAQLEENVATRKRDREQGGDFRAQASELRPASLVRHSASEAELAQSQGRAQVVQPLLEEQS